MGLDSREGSDSGAGLDSGGVKLLGGVRLQVGVGLRVAFVHRGNVALPFQGSAKRWTPGLVNFVTAVAYIPLLPHLACSIHATWGPTFSRALYTA